MSRPALNTPLPAMLDVESERIPAGLAPVIDAHVQCFDLESPDMEGIYRVCAQYQAPLIMHVGREPKSPAYPCDPYAICQARKLEAVIGSYPDLKVCVPHLGADEFERYRQLIKRYDNLWLDTAVALSGYLPLADQPVSLARYRADRILYGTDFPNIPYGWDREIRMLARLGLPEDPLARILGENARELFGSRTGRAGANDWEPRDGCGIAGS